MKHEGRQEPDSYMRKGMSLTLVRHLQLVKLTLDPFYKLSSRTELMDVNETLFNKTFREDPVWLHFKRPTFLSLT